MTIAQAMTVGTLPFLSALLVVASLVFFLPTARARQVLLALVSGAFLAIKLPNVESWIAFALFVASGQAMALLVRRCAAPSLRSWIIAAYLSALLFAFCLMKKYQFLTAILPTDFGFSDEVVVIGLSYMLFRQIHYVLDTADGDLQDASWWEYLNYQVNVFAIAAGPIQRFQDFRAQWAELLPTACDRVGMLLLFARMVWGTLKVGFIGALVLRTIQAETARQLHWQVPGDLFDFALLFYGYPLYIYLNFSGYCDVVIAGAALVGMRLPENFDKPFIARNMIDYWGRWHMTLSHWMRDYVFTPLYRGWIGRWPARANLAANGCYFIALFLVGVWHGGTWNFVVFGLLNGVGVVATKAWEGMLIRRWGRQGLKTYLKSPVIHSMAIIATLHFVCLTILFFPADLRGRLHFLYLFIADHAPMRVGS